MFIFFFFCPSPPLPLSVMFKFAYKKVNIIIHNLLMQFSAQGIGHNFSNGNSQLSGLVQSLEEKNY